MGNNNIVEILLEQLLGYFFKLKLVKSAIFRREVYR